MSTRHTTSPAPLARPTLLPGLPRLWRSRHRLQLGLDPARAVVLELPDPRAVHLLDLLDGTRSARAVITEAARRGVRGTDAQALLDVLQRAGLVVGAHCLLPTNLPAPLRQRLGAEAAALALRGTDAPAAPAQILRRRAHARILLVGRGSLAEPIALALAQAGIGHIAAAAAITSGTADQPADQKAGDPPDIPATIAAHAPGTRTDPLDRNRATFAVQLGDTAPAVVTAAGYAQRRLAHLAVCVRDGAAIIGPLVPPTGVPCLNCLDLHRQDRDPEWPSLAAQIVGAPGSPPCAVTTTLTAAGVAAGEVLSWIDGGSARTVGASLEIGGDGELRRRSWPPHPACQCVRRSRRAGPRPDRPSADSRR